MRFTTLLALVTLSILTSGARAQTPFLTDVLMFPEDTTGATTSPDGRYGTAVAAGDFDGDGAEDLAVGYPGAEISTQVGAGAVTIRYGGTSSAPDGVLSQNSAGFGEASESGDAFGAALAVGDFNRDGYQDLAIGAPGENLGAAVDTGVLHVVLGSATGLDGATEITLSRGLLGGVNEVDGQLASALAAGDFNGDGFDDLALGVPGETVDAEAGAGAVVVLYGSASGLQVDSPQPWNEAILEPGLPVVSAEADDRFGFSLAVGNFDGDDHDDLLIGIPGEDLLSTDQGQAVLIYGRIDGLHVDAAQRLWPATSYQNEFAEAGFAVAAGDLDGDGADEAVYSVPGYRLGSNLDVGMVWIHFGIPGSQEPLVEWTRYLQSGAGATYETGDRFGESLCVGDFNADGLDDLAVGAPSEAIGDEGQAGAVSIFLGARSGEFPGSTIHQDAAGISGTAEAGDRFGTAIAAAKVDGGGDALLVGVPGEDETAVDVGAAQLLLSRFLAVETFESGDLGDGWVLVD